MQCVVGNNKSSGAHGAGYNGIWFLADSKEAANSFVPAYAGVNLEHYFDARAERPKDQVLFEPRHAAMDVTRINERTVELHQPPTPVYGVESWTRFEVKEPYYTDFSCRLVPTKDVFKGGFMGVFWASYMNAPEDKSIYFLAPGATLDKPRWVQFCTQQHDRDSTVCQKHDDADIRFEASATALFNSISALRFTEPFFYGRVRDKVLIYIFQPNPGLRFAHSPSGGGMTEDGQDTCPAWDFQLIVPDYKVGSEYGISGRVVLKPWVSRADVLAEAAKYLGRQQ
jgi:hypothetical protein